MVDKRRTSARIKKETPAKRRKTEASQVEEEEEQDIPSAPVAVPLPTNVGENDVLPVVEKYATVVDRVLQTIAERCGICAHCLIYSY